MSHLSQNYWTTKLVPIHYTGKTSALPTTASQSCIRGIISFTSTLGRKFMLCFFACLSSMHIFLFWSNQHCSVVTRDSPGQHPLTLFYLVMLQTMCFNSPQRFSLADAIVLLDSTTLIVDVVFKPSFRTLISTLKIHEVPKQKSSSPYCFLYTEDISKILREEEIV